MLRLPTVSKMQTAMACDAAVVLEHEPDGPPSASAKRGTLLGAWAAASLRGWKMPDLGRYKIDWNIDELRAYLGAGDILCEAAFALDGDHFAEFLGENIGRQYPQDGRICGAADILVRNGDHGLLVDIKSGTYPVPEARDNWQLGTLAVMAADAFDLETVTGVIVRMERGGTWGFGERHTWDQAQLGIVSNRIRHRERQWRESFDLMSAGLSEPIAEQNPGCFFCRAKGCVFSRESKKEAA